MTKIDEMDYGAGFNAFELIPANTGKAGEPASKQGANGKSLIRIQS